MILPLLLSLQMTQDSGSVYAGLRHRLAVQIPRVDTAAVVIDGKLDDAVWSRAAVLTEFSQYQPVDSRPAEEPTEIRVFYGPTAIYFGIRAVEVHGDVVRATQANRDNIGADDNVQILLDTYDDRRRAYVFAVNPFGIQQDGIRSEGFAGGAGGFSAGGRTFTGNILDGNVDLNPDFVFESRGRLLPDGGGYEVEIRIPFKSLRYQDARVQRWGINVLRRIQHSGYQDSWAPVVRANASFLTQSGTLEGLHDLQRGLVMELTPTATAHANGALDTAGHFPYTTGGELGLDARWGITPNLGLTGTLNPDFSQVEADVGQVTINERFQLFFPEKRPFFLEGLELFDSPNQLIYTRRIVNPDWGVKVAGKAGGTDVAVLGAQDSPDQSLDGATPYFGAMRLRRDLGRNSTAGLVLTTREDGADYSRLAGADVHIVHSRLYYVELQAVQSWSDWGAGAVSGPLWGAVWDRTGRNWGFHYRITGVAPDFNAAVGFVNRTGVVNPSIFNRLTVYGSRGALIETASAFIGINRTYDYASFGSRDAIEGDESVTGSVTLRGGWNVAPVADFSFVSFDSAMYRGVAVRRGAAVDSFAVPSPATGLMSGSLRITTPTYRQFTASASAARAKVAVFPEASLGNSASYSAAIDWRPTGSLRASAQYVRLAIDRRRDGSRFSSQDIPRLKLEYQASRAIFFRFVGQYTATRTAALRTAQGDTMVVRQDTTWVPVGPSTSNDFRMDWLFSYRPSPGTLIYLGYGSSLSEPSAFAFGRNLHRNQDGFFTKVSYLLRL